MKILSYHHIEKSPTLILIKKIWAYLKSLDPLTRLMILTVTLIILSTPFIVANRQIFNPRAAGECTTIYSGNSNVLPKLDVAANQTICFDPNANTTVEISGNAIVNGVLRMQPANVGITHTLRFTGANENAFVGCTDPLNCPNPVPVGTDVGLWVMNAGKLEITGAARTGWARATNSLSAGGTSITLDVTPTGWQQGDEVLIVPTATGDFGDGEVRKILSISGKNLTLDLALSDSHPTVSLPDGRTLGAEIANLTRNVRIEGMKPDFIFPTASQNNNPGRSHIFIHNTSPVVQTVKYAAIRYMGPRKNDSLVKGRYGLHFHMSEENNRGTEVVGVVARDIGSHSFVPHKSHGITFRDTISYNSNDDAYWWDSTGQRFGENSTNDILYDHVLAAYLWRNPADPSGVDAIRLEEGLRNTIRNSAAVAVNGTGNSAGYHWPATANHGDNVWTFEDNLAHNNKGDGVFVWQNDNNKHVITRLTAYHNGRAGIEHGAYRNAYSYLDTVLFENGGRQNEQVEVILSASSQADPKNQKWNNFKVGTMVPHVLKIAHSSLDTLGITEFRDWNITKLGPGNKAVKIGVTGDKRNLVDLICWTLPGGAELEQSNFTLGNWNAITTIRVQKRNGTAYQFNGNSGSFTSIPSFATCDAAPSITPTRTPTPSVTPGPDTIPPTTSITAPTAGATVSGTVAISANASDNIGVAKVEFLVDGIIRGTDTTGSNSSYSVSWDTTNGGTHPCNGAHTHAITSKAYDTSNNTGTSAVRTVNMNNPSYCVNPTPTPTRTPTPTSGPTPTRTPTPTPTRTPTPTPIPPTPTPTPPPPSLQIWSLDFVPKIPSQGQDVTFEVSVANFGNNISSPTTVKFFDTNIEPACNQQGWFAQAPISSLVPFSQDTRTVVKQGGFSTSGTHSVWVFVDGECESSKVNILISVISLSPTPTNAPTPTRTPTPTIGPTSTPTRTPTPGPTNTPTPIPPANPSDLFLWSIGFTPNTPSRGQTITFEVSVANIGNNMSPNTTVRLYEGSTQPTCNQSGWFAEAPISPLVPFSQDTRTVVKQGGFSTLGTHTIWAFADGECIVNETNKSNNTQSISVNVN